MHFILQTPQQPNPLLAKVRRKEHEAFRDWIRAAVKDPGLLAEKRGEAKVGSELPVEVIRHARRDRVLSAFIDNVWSEIGRCINCHSPERNERLVEKHGEQMSWIRPRDPAGTLAQCVEQGIIDTDSPDESLILLKPLVLVEHGGGPKFLLGSRTDKNFRRFLTDYAAVLDGRYRRKDQLPRPTKTIVAPTGQHLRIVDLPEGMGKKMLKVDIFRWQPAGQWSHAPWAVGDGPVNGERRMWQTMVFATAPRGSRRANGFRQSPQHPLPSGRYLIKIYFDGQEKTTKDRDYELGEKEFIGQVEINGDWPVGYRPPMIVNAPK